MRNQATGAAAHDTQITVDGDVYFVRRDFDLIRRIEQAFGPLADLDRRLRRHELTAEDLVRLYGIVLKAQVSRPPVEILETHVMDEGIQAASEPLTRIVLTLFAGHKLAVAWLEAEAKAKADEDGQSENPQLPA